MNFGFLLSVLFLIFLGACDAFSLRRLTRGSKRVLQRMRPQPLSVQEAKTVNSKTLELIRMQPRPRRVERKLKERYASIDDVEDRAYQILLDLGMAEGESKKEADHTK